MSPTTKIEEKLEQVQEREWERIHHRRKVAFSSNSEPLEEVEPNSERPKNLVGLALSGGGLRSALFNEGFLQALSHHGLLRYVDYLCSVSGGGYIASRLMTYAGISENSNFHEDREEATEREQTDAPELDVKDRYKISRRRYPDESKVQGWHMGRDPDSGCEDDRMPQIGGYLNRTAAFTAGYFLRQIPIWAMYISMVGIVATCLALIFRSFDRRDFRAVYESLLGVRFGQELMVAMLPTLFVLTLTLLVSVLYRCTEFLSLFFEGKKSYALPLLLRRKLAGVSQAGLAITIVFLLTSIAIFLGNGITSMSGTNGSTWNLNHFATQIALAAGAIQILVFFGWDRLFKSEDVQSSPIQKYCKTLSLTGWSVSCSSRWFTGSVARTSATMSTRGIITC